MTLKILHTASETRTDHSQDPPLVRIVTALIAKRNALVMRFIFQRYEAATTGGWTVWGWRWREEDGWQLMFDGMPFVASGKRPAKVPLSVYQEDLDQLFQIATEIIDGD